MSLVRVLPLIVEVQDPTAKTASIRAARLVTAALTLIMIVPLVIFVEPPKLYLPKARALVINMRFEEELLRQQPTPESERRRLLAKSSPVTAPDVEKKPDPPKVVPETPPPPKPEVKKPEPRKQPPKERPKPRERKAKEVKAPAMMQKSVSIGEGKPQAGIQGGDKSGARVEVSAASRQHALAVLMEAIEKNKRYPRQARRSGAEGTVMLSIRIAADGHVKHAAVSRNCGIGSLDLESARLAERLKGLNTGVSGAAFTVVVPVKYQLVRR